MVRSAQNCLERSIAMALCFEPSFELCALMALCSAPSNIDDWMHVGCVVCGEVVLELYRKALSEHPFFEEMIYHSRSAFVAQHVVATAWLGSGVVKEPLVVCFRACSVSFG
eukprot:3836736-Amphidinium_carterae.1